jgi:hypothetical protein
MERVINPHSAKYPEKLTILLPFLFPSNRAPPGSDWQYVLIQDRVGAGRKNLDKDGIKAIYSELADYYPETVAEILITNANWIFWAVWHIVKVFMDANTSKKVFLQRNSKRKTKKKKKSEQKKKKRFRFAFLAPI